MLKPREVKSFAQIWKAAGQKLWFLFAVGNAAGTAWPGAAGGREPASGVPLALLFSPHLPGALASGLPAGVAGVKSLFDARFEHLLAVTGWCQCPAVKPLLLRNVAFPLKAAQAAAS